MPGPWSGGGAPSRVARSCMSASPRPLASGIVVPSPVSRSCPGAGQSTATSACSPTRTSASRGGAPCVAWISACREFGGGCLWIRAIEARGRCSTRDRSSRRSLVRRAASEPRVVRSVRTPPCQVRGSTRRPRGPGRVLPTCSLRGVELSTAAESAVLYDVDGALQLTCRCAATTSQSVTAGTG